MSAPAKVSGDASAAARLSITPVWARRVAWLLLALVGVFIVYSFGQHGISNDEEVQHVYGRLLVDFYGSGFADRTAFEYKNLYLYGGLFDLIAATLEKVVPMNVWDLRHLLSAGFGLLGLVGTWLLARLLAGEWAGLLALLLLSISGAWSGAMFTHTKDVPFATTMVWALYFTTRFAATLPRFRASDLVGLGVAIGCAFGLRVGAVFAVFYLGCTVLAGAWLHGTDLRSRLAVLGRAVLALLPAAVLAFALMGFFWPWAVLSTGNLVKAMTTFSHFSFDLYTIVNGVVMKNGDVPGTYLLTYLLIRLPELFLLGVALALLGGLRALPDTIGTVEGRERALRWLPAALAALFPLAYTLLAAPPLYNGIRHFTFLLPPLAVLGGAGLYGAWQHAARWPRARLAAAGACVLLVAGQVVTLARLHPYEYIAYNGFIGGVRGSEGRWEMDYWGDSLRPAAALLNAYVAAEGPAPRTYTVAVCAESVQGSAWLAPGLEVTRDWRVADFFLSPTQMDCHTAVKGRIIGEIAREGVTLAVVRDRRMLEGADRDPRIPK
ncbi:MAG TPA: glycosyltransferase family 39 protein [Aromatoleum sp.]|uniref:glycosyltransferase family 39 protein n=1 Tax=Aromatoleum sp. TaxID=2307007 RepID=UPI002B46F8BF|nr:glycosyltransferase family 39 protein [Aromatoleum sp.]HJV28689.1 glycosyltransferase family 39 protein [Aromatoleum sp.]